MTRTDNGELKELQTYRREKIWDRVQYTIMGLAVAYFIIRILVTFIWKI